MGTEVVHFKFVRKIIMFSLSIINGGVFLSSRQSPSSSDFHSFAACKWGQNGEHDRSLFAQQTRSSRAIRVLANPNASSSDRKNSKKEIFMVDPLEAKRLAAKQMEKVKAKEKSKNQRQIEALNGAWAMIGLTAGFVIEGHTGNSILAQLVGYWTALVSFFVR